MKALFRKVLAVLVFFDRMLSSVVGGVAFRRRVIDRTTITTGSSPDPNRRPRRR
jgi:hypothetical protein